MTALLIVTSINLACAALLVWHMLRADTTTPDDDAFPQHIQDAERTFERLEHRTGWEFTPIVTDDPFDVIALACPGRDWYEQGETTGFAPVTMEHLHAGEAVTSEANLNTLLGLWHEPDVLVSPN